MSTDRPASEATVDITAEVLEKQRVTASEAEQSTPDPSSDELLDENQADSSSFLAVGSNLAFQAAQAFLNIFISAIWEMQEERERQAEIERQRQQDYINDRFQPINFVPVGVWVINENTRSSHSPDVVDRVDASQNRYSLNLRELHDEMQTVLPQVIKLIDAKNKEGQLQQGQVPGMYRYQGENFSVIYDDKSNQISVYQPGKTDPTMQFSPKDANNLKGDWQYRVHLPDGKDFQQFQQFRQTLKAEVTSTLQQSQQARASQTQPPVKAAPKVLVHQER